MANIWVNCSHCGKMFAAPDEMAGQNLACPQCGKPVAVFAAGAQSGAGPKLQVRHEETVTGAKRCPACQSTMTPDAVICVQCGYDTRTGSRYIETLQKSRILQWVLWGFGLLIAAALVIKLIPNRTGTVQSPAVTGPAPEVSGSVTSAPAAVSLAAGAPTSPPSTEANSTNKSPVDLAKLEAEYRVTLAQNLENTYPMFAAGDSVVLRRVNGLVQRGTLVELKPNAVRIVNNSETNEIPFNVLDRPSRLKCDPAFRAQLVEFHAQKRVKELADF